MGAQSGSAIRNRRSTTVGTFGCLVHRPTEPGSLFILSASHVIALNGLALRDDPIVWRDGNGEREIGRFVKFVKFGPGGTGQVCDAAIARVTDVNLVDPTIPGIGLLQPGVSTGLYVGKPLALCGAKSGSLNNLALHSREQPVPMTYRGSGGAAAYTVQFTNQIFYGRMAANTVNVATEGGDSGALVFDSLGQAVGLHIGRTPKSFPVSASVCTPITNVLAALDVELVTQANWADVRSNALTVTAQGGAARQAPTAPPPAAAPPAAPPPPNSQLVDVFETAVEDRLSEISRAVLGIAIGGLLRPHRFADSVSWSLSAEGLIVGDRLAFSPGKLVTVPRVWETFGSMISSICDGLGVPVELAVATVCTESSGDPRALRIEPGWQSDEATPHRMSAGLMQTLLSTARESLSRPSLTRADLFIPEISLAAGLSYIKMQRSTTSLDPPKVAAAYNAGSLRLDKGANNRWRLKQFPIGTGEHVDRFVMWFNDCFRFFATLDSSRVPRCSFYRLMKEAGV